MEGGDMDLAKTENHKLVVLASRDLNSGWGK